MNQSLILLICSILSLSSWAEDSQLKEHVADRLDEVEYIRDAEANKSYTEKTNIPVCTKVAKKLKSLSRKRWVYRQVSQKFRNSNNKPAPAEKIAFEKFKNKPRLSSYWSRDIEGFRYFRQIKAEAKCLQCHGPRTKVFSAIKTNYPNDLSLNFKEGQLIGIYSVLKKDKK